MLAQRTRRRSQGRLRARYHIESDSGTPARAAVGDHALTGAGPTRGSGGELVEPAGDLGLRLGVRQPVAALGLDHLTALAQLGQQRADRPGGNSGGVGDLRCGLWSAV
jgi:hypothetical protein